MKLYNLALPTSNELVGGFKQNSNVRFVFFNEGEELVKNTVRLNGLLSITKTDASGVTSSASLTDKLILDADAGVHGFIYSINTKFGSSVAESIVEYGRFVKMSNEAKKYQIETAVDSHSMCELMTYSNDANITDDVKENAFSGLLIPSTAGLYQMPFSVELDMCLNNSIENIPFSRTGKVELSLQLQAVVKTGLMSLKTAVVGETFDYSFSNVELRYETVPEKPNQGGIILETKNSNHTPTISNKLSSIAYQSSNAFDSIVISFMNNSHITALNNKNYNYLQTESIGEKINNLEIKINGRNSVLDYSLTKQTSEIVYNYLLAFRPYIFQYDNMEVRKHGLSYKKLAQETQTAGFGVGCNFSDGLDSGTSVQFNLNLNTVPASPYQCFVYSIGRLII